MAGMLRQALEAWLEKANERQIADSIDMAEGKRGAQEQARAAINVRLKEVGRRAVPTEGFGRCQFLAVTRAGATAATAQELRESTCDVIMALPEQFQGLFVDPQAFDRYVQDMRQPFEWGDHLTLQGIAEVLHRPIHIFEYDAEHGVREIVVEPGNSPRGNWGAIIYVARYDWQHYEATVPASAREPADLWEID